MSNTAERLATKRRAVQRLYPVEVRDTKREHEDIQDTMDFPSTLREQTQKTMTETTYRNKLNCCLVMLTDTVFLICQGLEYV